MSIAIGEEILVNTTTVEDQAKPAVTMLADGGWVVTWQSFGQDGDLYGIYLQRYDAQGQIVGQETKVNTENLDQQRNPTVTALADGGWLVSWQSTDQDGDGNGVYFQRYDKDGVTYGKEMRANTEFANHQSDPVVAGLPDGGWLIAWRSVGQDGANGGIYYQRYDSSGVVVGPETLVNTETASAQTSPAIRVLQNGDWVIAWQSNGQDGDGWGIYQQVYHNDGNTYGLETHVNSFTTFDQTEPSIAALADGGFVVTWKSDQQDGDGTGIYQQRFAANGTKLGNEVKVNWITPANLSEPVTAGLSDGGWMVSWTSMNPDMTLDVYQRRYDADGNPTGGETLINTVTGNDQSAPAMTGLPDGGWLAAWQSIDQDDAGMMNGGIYLKTFKFVNEAPSGENLFIDLIEDTAHQFTIANFGFNDVDGHDFAGFKITGITGDGSLTLKGEAVAVDAIIAAEDIADLVWTPPENALGNLTGSISFLVMDDGGTVNGGQDTDQSENTIVFNITTPVNDAPEGADKTIAVAEDKPYIFSADDFGFADVDGDLFGGILITELPTAGSLTLKDVAVVGGPDMPVVVDIADIGELVWTPDADANGANLASLSFQVMDTGGTGNGGIDTDPVASMITFDVSEVIDKFMGTRSADKLAGTEGDDFFQGKKGRDTLTGLGGSDLFVFKNGDGKDKITDFTTKGDDHDVLDLSRLSSITGYKDLVHHHLKDTAAGLLIDGHNGDSIFLVGLDKADLIKGDFDF